MLTEYAPWYERNEPHDLGTGHLPDEVVRTEFLLAVNAVTSDDSPRKGGMNFSLNYGGLHNPDLSNDDIGYIVASVLACLEGLRPPRQRVPG